VYKTGQPPDTSPVCRGVGVEVVLPASVVSEMRLHCDLSMGWAVMEGEGLDPSVLSGRVNEIYVGYRRCTNC
jgi:hypothetical protein